MVYDNKIIKSKKNNPQTLIILLGAGIIKEENALPTVTFSRNVENTKLALVSAGMETGRKEDRQTVALFLTVSDSEVLDLFSVNSAQI